MADLNNINQSEEKIGNSNVMKELSDIKSSLAVNTSETQNIKGSIVEIKADIREIKTKYVNFEQHKVLQDVTSDHEARLRVVEINLTRVMTYGTALILLLGVLEFIINKFLR